MAPTIFQLGPPLTVPAGTTATDVVLGTDVPADCRCATFPDVSFDAMASCPLSSNDGTLHFHALTGFRDGSWDVVYVRCRDRVTQIANPTDFVVRVQVATPNGEEHLYRSVQPNRTGALVSTAGGLRLRYSIAYFEAGLPSEVGVGDLLVFTLPIASTEVASIVRRLDARRLLISDPNGGRIEAPMVPLDWSIWRAHVSLQDALDGVGNPGLPMSLRAFDTVATSNVLAVGPLHIACYDGTDAPAQVSNWGTAESHYLHIYTPRAPFEVGVDQHHGGVWQPGGYILQPGAPQEVLLIDNTAHVHVQGLQILVDDLVDVFVGIAARNQPAHARARVSECLFDGRSNGGGGEHIGIEQWLSHEDAKLEVLNNILVGFTGTADIEVAIGSFEGRVIAGNNTIVGSKLALGIELSPDDRGPSSLIAFNNLIQKCDVAAQGSFEAGTGYNLTDTIEMGYVIETAGPPPDTDNLGITVAFTDANNWDYHLATDSEPAVNAGYADWLRYSTDIDGEQRSAPWDIGADEW